MGTWTGGDDLRELARLVIAARADVAHVVLDEVLFLHEHDTDPPALARCYKLIDHPIEHFAFYRWAIVVFERNAEHLTRAQRAILLWHELLHIPATGSKLVKHDLQDFVAVVGHAGAVWQEAGATVPDILGEVTEDDTTDGVSTDAERAKAAGGDAGSGKPAKDGDGDL